MSLVHRGLIGTRSTTCREDGYRLRALLRSTSVDPLWRELRPTWLEGSIALGAWPNTTAMLTSAYFFVVGGIVVMGLLRLHRVRSGGEVSMLAAFGVTAGVAAWLGGRIGGGLFEALALLSWGVFAIAPLALLGIAWLRRPHRGWRIGGSVAAFAIWGVAVHAFVLEPTWLEVTHVEHRTTKVDRELTIALVADFQTDRIGDYERRVLAEIAEAQPDLVLWAGDYFQIEDPVAYRREIGELRAALRESGIEPPLGMFAVRGNSETRATWWEIFDRTKIVPISTTRRIAIADDVSLTALSLEDSFDANLRVEPTPGFHLVLGHGPDYALGDVDADLLFAGHTHGGQVRIPGLGPILTLSRIPRAWATGITRLDEERTLVVSRGVGMERGPAPRLRFACRPELVFIHVRPK